MKDELAKLLEEIADKNSEWSVVMDNILEPNYHLKPQLISELALYIYDHQKTALDALKSGWFKFWFISICSNQVKSSTSLFHRNNRQLLNERHNKHFNKIYNEMQGGFSVEEHKELETVQKHRAAIVKTAMKNIEPKCKWIENEMARLHYTEGLSFRDIERHFEGSIKYSRAHQLFKRWNAKFKEELNRLKSNS